MGSANDKQNPAKCIMWLKLSLSFLLQAHYISELVYRYFPGKVITNHTHKHCDWNLLIQIPLCCTNCCLILLTFMVKGKMAYLYTNTVCRPFYPFPHDNSPIDFQSFPPGKENVFDNKNEENLNEKPLGKRYIIHVTRRMIYITH